MKGFAPTRADEGASSVLGPVVRGTSLVFGGFILANLLNLGFQVLVARNLSTADLGRYFEIIAVVGIALSVAVGGVRAGVVRHVATLDDGTAAWLARRLVFGDAVVSAGIAVVLFVVAPLLSDRIFHDSTLVPVFRMACVAIPFAASASLWAAVARGRRSFGYHVLTDQISMPGARLLLGLALLLVGLGLDGAVWAYVGACAVSALVGAVAAWRMGILRAPLTERPPHGLVGGAIRFSAYRWGVDVLQVVLLWADTIMLGSLVSSVAAGIYGVAGRVIVFSSVGLSALNLVISPFIARDVRQGPGPDMARRFGIWARWATILTVVPLGLVLALQESVLRLFGPGFTRGSTALSILVVGFAANAACGPVGVVLTMSALNRLVLVDNLLTVAVNIALNVWLIPWLGTAGAAIAWSTALVLINVLMLYQVRARIGIAVLGFIQVRTALALAPVLALAWTLAHVSPVVAAVATAVGAFGAVMATRVPEEAAMVREAVARLRGASIA